MQFECLSTQLSPQTVWLAEEQGEVAGRCLVQIINEVKIEELYLFLVPPLPHFKISLLDIMFLRSLKFLAEIRKFQTSKQNHLQAEHN